MPMNACIWPSRQLLPGDDPRVLARKTLPMKPYVRDVEPPVLHTAKDVPGDDLGSGADIGLLELERDLRLDPVLLDVARREDRAGECDVHVDAVHEGLVLEQFSSGLIHYPRRITLLTNLARKS